MNLRDRWFDVNGIRLHAVECGDGDAPAVLLLHGFPEYWACWRPQMRALADAGFRAIALDQRGYDTSDKPPHIRDYGLDLLAEDVEGVVREVGGPVHLVAHDWGGGVAWWTALRSPELIRRLVILNAPHPRAMRKVIARRPRQMLSSWYMGFFQLPWLPETLLRARNFALAAWVLTSMSAPGTFSDEELGGYRDAWGQPGALRSMIHWYRALTRTKPQRPKNRRVTVPTRIVWGRRDTALVAELAQRSADECDRAEVIMIDDATHWLHHEQPERISRLIVEFLLRTED